MTFALRQTFKLECSVCKQWIENEHEHETAEIVILFGAERYAVCPCCFQSVDDLKDRRYRHRVDAFIAERERCKQPHVDHFYDRTHRVWTVIKKDAQGNQIGDAVHCMRDQLKREIADARVELFNQLRKGL